MSLPLQIKTAHIFIYYARNLHIQAERVNIVCTSLNRCLDIKDRTNPIISGLTIGAKTLPYTRGKITRIRHSYLTAGIDKGYDSGIKDF